MYLKLLYLRCLVANDLNRVLLIGRLTRDPELRSTNSGTMFCRFSIASNRSYYKKEGDVQEYVGYFECVAWGKLSEIISKYLSKGKRIGVDGSLRWSQWENQEGKKQSKIEIHVENFQFLEPRGSSHSDSEGSQTQVPESSQNVEVPAGSDIMNDDDIPF